MMLDALLTFVFASVGYYFSKKNDMGVVNDSLINMHTYKKNYYILFVLKYSCLTVICLNGIMVPSTICCTYYVLFVTIMTITVLFGLSDTTTAHIFRLTCLYTCFHLLLLFIYQIELIRNIAAINSNVAK